MRKAKAKLDRAIVEGAEKILHNRTLRRVVSADTTIRPRRPSLGAPSPTLSIERPTRSRSLPRYRPPPPPTEHPPAPPRNQEEVPLSPAEVSIYSPAEEEIPFSSAEDTIHSAEEESQYIEMSDWNPRKLHLSYRELILKQIPMRKPSGADPLTRGKAIPPKLLAYLL